MAYRKRPPLTDARKRQMLTTLCRRYGVLQARKLVFNRQIAAAQARGLALREIADALDEPLTTVGRWSRDVA